MLLLLLLLLLFVQGVVCFDERLAQLFDIDWLCREESRPPGRQAGRQAGEREERSVSELRLMSERSVAGRRGDGLQAHPC
jgi:hypothetical protein